MLLAVRDYVQHQHLIFRAAFQVMSDHKPAAHLHQWFTLFRTVCLGVRLKFGNGFVSCSTLAISIREPP